MSSAGKDFDEWFQVWHQARLDQMGAAFRDARRDLEDFGDGIFTAWLAFDDGEECAVSADVRGLLDALRLARGDH